MMEHGPFDLDSLPVNVIGIGAFIAKSTGERAAAVLVATAASARRPLIGR